MSVVVTLTSMMVCMAITAAPGVGVLGITKMIEKFSRNPEEAVEPILTRFNDSAMLKKTLEEHGFPVTVQEDGSLIMAGSGGKVRFYREEGQEAYCAAPVELANVDGLCEELEELNEEYMANVQTYTYQTLKENLSGRQDLTLESEQVLEDDTILLTLTVN